LKSHTHNHERRKNTSHPYTFKGAAAAAIICSVGFYMSKKRHIELHTYCKQLLQQKQQQKQHSDIVTIRFFKPNV